MAAHTPGPWTATHCDGPPYKYDLPRSVYAGAIPIASIAGQAGGGPSTWVANARLIAAAPDLLAACKDLLCRQDDKAHDRARAAIAKAEDGES